MYPKRVFAVFLEGKLVAMADLGHEALTEAERVGGKLVEYAYMQPVGSGDSRLPAWHREIASTRGAV